MLILIFIVLFVLIAVKFLSGDPESYPAQKKEKAAQVISSDSITVSRDSIDVSNHDPTILLRDAVRNEELYGSYLRVDSPSSSAPIIADPAADPEILKNRQLLLNELVNGTNHSKFDVVKSLAKFKDVEVYQALFDFMLSNDTSVSEVTALLLYDMDQETTVRKMMELADHNDDNLRYLAIVTLGKIKDKRAYPIILNAVKHEQGDVQVAAIMAIANFPTNEGLQALNEALASKNHLVRDKAQKAIFKISVELGR
ncbi:MAG: hypothetical protein A2X86_09960 [Bdellovibrionales bacterium GWA2_49_15]|nr:MAG: hypothetical protein A2X86_09960 [Bdellovibrionales bacterium GWA2_49_15]